MTFHQSRFHISLSSVFFSCCLSVPRCQAPSIRQRDLTGRSAEQILWSRAGPSRSVAGKAESTTREHNRDGLGADERPLSNACNKQVKRSTKSKTPLFTHSAARPARQLARFARSEPSHQPLRVRGRLAGAALPQPVPEQGCTVPQALGPAPRRPPR